MSYVSRLGALVAASALTLTGITLVASAPAQAATDNRPVTIATKWLKNQLTDGLIHNNQYDFDDIGLSVDAGFGLASVGGQDATVGQIADAIRPNLTTGYAQGDEYAFDPPYAFVQVGYYGAQTAKALVFAQTVGESVTNWDGLNLLAAVEDRVDPITGRLSSDSSYGDFTNTIGQAYAARGLSGEGSSEAEAATTFLLRQQCAAGFFRLELTANTCDADAGTADTDVTAIAVQQLASITGPSPAVTAALAAAKTWLQGAQLPDGSFGSSAPTTAPNANSTGQAGLALGVLGDSAGAIKAAVWVRGRQADELNGCPSPLFAETGALAYDDAATAAARQDGIVVSAEDQWRRATAPILAILLNAPTATPDVAIVGPTGFRQAGTSATYTVSGVVPGDKVCLSAFGTNRPVISGASGTGSIKFTLPTATATHTLSVKDRSGDVATVTTKVLGARTLAVKPAVKRVKKGKAVWVTVSGLAVGESVTLRYRGVVVATGKANSAGKFVRPVKVGQRLGTAGLSATGQFPTIRKGATTITVIR